MMQSAENDARCPDDGQSVEWHRHVGGTHYDGSPRTNGEFIGCDFGRGIPSEARRLVRCDEVGDEHWPHPWTDDEFPERRMWCSGAPIPPEVTEREAGK